MPGSVLTHSPADVLRWLFIALGLGTEPPAPGEAADPWPVYATSEPSTPDDCLTIYDTVGLDGGRLMPSGELQHHYGFQVRVRSVDHRTGWTKAATIRETLAEDVYQERVTIEGATYRLHCVSRIGPVIALGKDVPTSKRSLFTVNAVMVLEEE